MVGLCLNLPSNLSMTGRLTAKALALPIHQGYSPPDQPLIKINQVANQLC
jgi:hypothetical protein